MEKIMGIREKFALFRMSYKDKYWDNPEYLNLRMADNPKKTLDDYYKFIMDDDYYIIYEPLDQQEFLTYVIACDYRVDYLQRILAHTHATTDDWFQLAKINPSVLKTDSFSLQFLNRHDDVLSLLLENPNLVEHAPSFDHLYKFAINKDQDPEMSKLAKKQLEKMSSVDWISLASKNPRVLGNEAFRDLCYTDWGWISSRLDERPHFVQYLPTEIRESYEASNKEIITPERKIDLTNKIIPPHFRAKYGDRDFRITTETEYEVDPETCEGYAYTKFYFYAKNEKGYHEQVDCIIMSKDFEEIQDKYVLPEIFAKVKSGSYAYSGTLVNSGNKEYFASEDFRKNDYSSYETGKRRDFEVHLRDDFYEDEQICLNLAKKFKGDFLDKFAPNVMSNEEFIWKLVDELRGYPNDLLEHVKCDSIFEDEKILKFERELKGSIDLDSLFVLEHHGMINEEFMFKALTEFPQIEKHIKSFMNEEGVEDKYPFLFTQAFYTKIFDTNPEIVKYLTYDQELTKLLYERDKNSFQNIARAVCSDRWNYYTNEESNHFIFDIGSDYLLSMINNNEDKDKIVASCNALFYEPCCNNQEVANKLLENPQFNDFIKSLDNNQKHTLYRSSDAMFAKSLDNFFHLIEECGFEVDKHNLHGHANKLFGGEEDYEKNFPVFRELYHELNKTGSKFRDLPGMKVDELVDYANKFLERKDLKDKIEKETAEKPITKAQQLSNDLENDLAIAKPIQETKKARMKI